MNVIAAPEANSVFFQSRFVTNAIFSPLSALPQNSGWKAASWLLPMHREQRRRLVDCTQCIESSRDCHYGCIDVLETVGSDDENSHFEP